jgi:thiazolinyl imide reductase
VTAAGRRPPAVVVGATFGALYAEALAAPESPVELVGLVSTGSAASAELADRLGVGLYTGVDDLPGVEVAFVVVRSGVVGGDGTRICGQLLSRGVHVLQEQPVHGDEILSLLRTAAANSVLYAVNDFYSHVAPVRQFLGAAQQLGDITPVSYVHARSSLQVIYPLFTILAGILGALTPATIAVPEHRHGPFVAGRMVLGEVPVDLAVQNELCATDPDNYARLMHTITVGSEAGELVLAHTHGSTRWHPRLHTGVGDAPLSELVGAAFEPTSSQVRAELWPQAVRSAARQFISSIGRVRTGVSQRFVRATRLWADYTSAMGPATPIDAQPPVRGSDRQVVSR